MKRKVTMKQAVHLLGCVVFFVGVFIIIDMLVAKLSAFVEVGFHLENLLRMFLRYFPKKAFIVLTGVFFAGAFLAQYTKPSQRSMTDHLYRYRYVLAALVFIALVLGKIHGSSLGLWSSVFDTIDTVGDGTLFGVVRPVRGDEWSVFTPMAIAQGADPAGAYPYMSSLLSGGKTDMFIVYGQPVWDVAMIFRPFQIGYLFFGAEYGLSMYWCGRFLALFMVSMEAVMLFTQGNKKLAFIGALLIALAPVVQWWYSINALVEMLVFGQLAIILLYHYMQTTSWKRRALYLLGMMLCAGGYILTLYPPWMIPLFYVFVIMAVFIIVRNRAVCTIKKHDVFMLLGMLAFLGLLLLRIYNKSSDAIHAMLNSAYPGGRLVQGGDASLSYLGNYLLSLFIPYESNGLVLNQSEASAFIAFYPLGILLSLYVMFRRRRVDAFLVMALVLDALLLLWGIWGTPAWVSQITLLSFSNSLRIMQVIGFLHVYVLLRAMSLCKENPSRVAGLGMSIASFAIAFGLCIWAHGTYLATPLCLLFCVLLCVLYLPAFYFLTCANAPKRLNCLLGNITLIVLFSSVLVNPVASGIAPITAQPKYAQIAAIEEEDPGLWFVDAAFAQNFPAMVGARTINSIQTYPHIDLWRILDPEGAYEDVYNRYAHIEGEIVKKEQIPFTLRGSDFFRLSITPDQLVSLGVDYVLSWKNLENLSTDQVQFIPFVDDEEGPYHIYAVKKSN